MASKMKDSNKPSSKKKRREYLTINSDGKFLVDRAEMSLFPTMFSCRVKIRRQHDDHSRHSNVIPSIRRISSAPRLSTYVTSSYQVNYKIFWNDF